MKTLSSDQIQQLFQFCEKHCVRYYDVQVELVDHLASAIEYQFSINPHINFDEALILVYKSFGATGFGKYISERNNFFTKKIASEKRKIFLSFFTLPKIVLTTSILLSILYPFIIKNYFLIKYVTIFSVTLGIITMISCFIYSIIKKKKIRTNKKLWLLQNGIVYTGMNISILNFNAQVLLNKNSLYTSNFVYIYSLFIVLTSFVAILLTIAGIQQNKKLREFALSNYPEVFQKIS